MKKKIALIMAGTLAMVSLVGCSSEQDLVTQYASVSGTMADYNNLEVNDVALMEVSDEDIELALTNLPLANGQTTEITDRAVEEGDTANINYVGTMDGEEFDGGTADNVDLLIGSGSFIDGFEDGLIGVSIGETVTLELAFPDDYDYTDYAGLEVTFEVTVNSISLTIYPELSDELIQEISDTCETIEEYEAELRETYEAENLEAQLDGKKEEIWTALVDNTVLDEYDDDALQVTVDYLNELYSYQAYYYYGLELEEFVSYLGLTTDEFDAYLLTMAEQAYISDVIICYIAVEEDLLPSDDVFQEYMDGLLSTYGYDDEETFLTDMGMSRDEVKIEYLTEVVLDWLVDVVTYVEATEDVETTEAE